jgi:hypothetical protein
VSSRAQGRQDYTPDEEASLDEGGTSADPSLIALPEGQRHFPIMVNANHEVVKGPVDHPKPS